MSLAASGLIAGAYAALTLLLAPISYGAIQFRLSELLCVLPFFFPMSAAGLFAGCAIANLFSPAGALDVVFGSLATLLAGLCTAAVGKRSPLFSPGAKAEDGTAPAWGHCILACAMPVIFNAVIVGAALAWTLSPQSFWEGFVLFGAQVGLGEAAVMFLVGLPVMRLLLRNREVMALFARLRGNSPQSPAGDRERGNSL